jgi:hypothetical protein
MAVRLSALRAGSRQIKKTVKEHPRTVEGIQKAMKEFQKHGREIVD